MLMFGHLAGAAGAQRESVHHEQGPSQGAAGGGRAEEDIRGDTCLASRFVGLVFRAKGGRRVYEVSSFVLVSVLSLNTW